MADEIPSLSPEAWSRLAAAAGVRVFRLGPDLASAPAGLRADPRLPEALQRLRTNEVANAPGQVTLEHALFEGGSAPEGWGRTTLTRAPGGGDEVLGLTVDVSAERAHERQWQAVEGWLSALGEALPFDFWIVDRAGRCMLQNATVEARLGPVLGRRLEELPLPESWRESWLRGFRRALLGETSQEELQCSLGGIDRHLVRVVSPVRVEGGVQGALAVDLDVSELKRVEAQLHASFEELRRTQEVLVQRRELAALGEMAAVVAHEIRNPLGAIANVAALLRRQPPNIVTAELQLILDDEVARLDALVRALLEFVRPIAPVLEQRAVAPVLEDALQRELGAEGMDSLHMEIVRELDRELTVEMDGPLLRIALGHVVRNALQALAVAEGGRTLLLRVEREGEQAKLTVRDSGRGLAPEIRRRLFQPFATTRTTGSGLGLAVVRRIVEAHRGTVSLDEALPGVACVIRLPLSR